MTVVGHVEREDGREEEVVGGHKVWEGEAAQHIRALSSGAR